VILAKEPKNLTEEEKQRFIIDLKNTIPIAKEAQEKIGRFLMIALDKSPDDLSPVTQLISMVS